MIQFSYFLLVLKLKKVQYELSSDWKTVQGQMKAIKFSIKVEREQAGNDMGLAFSQVS